MQSKNNLLSTIFRESSHVFILKILSAVFSFVSSVVLARILGAEGAGIYYIALSVATISSAISKLGLDSGITFSIAKSRPNSQSNKSTSSPTTIFKTTLVSSIVVTALIFFNAGYIANEVFGKPYITAALKWSSVAVIPLTLIAIYSCAFTAAGKYIKGELVGSLIWPLANIVGIIFLARAFGAEGATISLLVATGISAAIGFFLWSIEEKAKKSSMAFGEVRQLVRSFWLAGIINQGLMPLGPSILLGILSTTSDVAIFSIAFRITLIFTFLNLAIKTIVSPRIAALSVSTSYTKIRLLHLNIIASLFFIVLVPAALAIIFSEKILFLFGSEFVAGKLVLVVLVAAQSINCIFSASGYFLSMTGHINYVSNISIIAAIILFVSAFMLIVPYGSLGAAISILIVAVFTQVVTFIFAWYIYTDKGTTQ